MTDEQRQVLEQWRAAWPNALADWSPFVQLREPIWCFQSHEEKRESLTGSFAMIRLVDHAVVISLRQVLGLGLGEFAHEILAHEIGHHVYCPADLTDNARLLARIRRGLPGCETYAPMVANLYADLLINDRLQRGRGRNMSGVYQRLQQHDSDSKLWNLYLRIYELLWSLAPATLARATVDSQVNQDAWLGCRLVRSYSREWLSGAGRFACLLFPYVRDGAEQARAAATVWCDTLRAGAGGCPEGLSEMDDDEEIGCMHPAEDPVLSGLDPIQLDEKKGSNYGRLPSHLSGRKSIKSFRDPFEYAELLKASGSDLSEREIAVRYYRERALPYVVPFPSKPASQSLDPFPEGLDVWDPSSDVDRIDWVSTLLASSTVVPGVTTRERLIGQSPGAEPEKVPFDLYLGVDCSGSMGDPARTLSYPVLAGAVMAISAIRAGANVQVVLSGEPGSTRSTDGFIRNQTVVLQTLVHYLGTGYSFGIHRLRETFHDQAKRKRPVHILILSDYDMFQMLDESGDNLLGWDVARNAALHCGGGATYVLQLPGYDGYGDRFRSHVERMHTDGWNVHLVNSMEELIVFARRFSRQHYSRFT